MSSHVATLYWTGMLVLFFFWSYGIVSFVLDLKNKIIPGLIQYRRGRRREKAKQEQDESRRSQVGTGERSERIRTYNFPQSRITDHRINLTTYNLDAILDGDLDQLIDPLEKNFQAANLKSAVQV